MIPYPGAFVSGKTQFAPVYSVHALDRGGVHDFRGQDLKVGTRLDFKSNLGEAAYQTWMNTMPGFGERWYRAGIDAASGKSRN